MMRSTKYWNLLVRLSVAGREDHYYTSYSAELRAKIGKHALCHGTASAVREFTRTLEKPVSKSIARYPKTQYAKASYDGPVDSLDHNLRGRPLPFGGTLDMSVQNYL